MERKWFTEDISLGLEADVLTFQTQPKDHKERVWKKRTLTAGQKKRKHGRENMYQLLTANEKRYSRQDTAYD